MIIPTIIERSNSANVNVLNLGNFKLHRESNQHEIKSVQKVSFPGKFVMGPVNPMLFSYQ